MSIKSQLASVFGRPFLLVVAMAAFGFAGWHLWPVWEDHRRWRNAEEALERRDFAVAINHLKEIVERNPKDSQSRFMLARTLRRAGKYDDAKLELRRSDWVSDIVQLEEQLLHVQQLGTRGPIRDGLKAALFAKHPDERAILEAIVMGDRHVLDLDHAAMWLNIWVDHFPEDWTGRQWRAELMESFKHFDEAKTDYLKLLQLKPEKTEVYRRLGFLALADKSQFAEAEDWFQKYLKHHTDDAESWFGIARSRSGRGETEGAIAALEKTLAAQPAHGEAMLLMASLRLEMAQPAESLRWLEKAKSTRTEVGKLEYQLFQVYTRLGNAMEAAKHEAKFKRSRQLTQELDQSLGQLLKEPGQPERHHRIGELYVALERDQDAERWFLGALHQDQRYRPSHLALAELYARRTDADSGYQAELHRRVAEKLAEKK
ncbi:MAG: tetratricopeptide repeat protein [Gemmataceae bacterium]|nr:tetratricopeptide repeat protein [Gemmataceae bacterium]